MTRYVIKSKVTGLYRSRYGWKDDISQARVFSRRSDASQALHIYDLRSRPAYVRHDSEDRPVYNVIIAKFDREWPKLRKAIQDKEFEIVEIQLTEIREVGGPK